MKDVTPGKTNKMKTIHINQSALIAATEMCLACSFNTYTIKVSSDLHTVTLTLDYDELMAPYPIEVNESMTFEDLRRAIESELKQIDFDIAVFESERTVRAACDPTIGID